MAEHIFNDGSDNYAAAAKHISRAAQSARRSTAAAASVKAGAATGKAVAGSAAGVAMTGPWGAALSAAWELRHTLFKVLIFLCLLVLFFIILIVSIPSILLGSVLGDDSTGAQTLQANYNSLAYVVDTAVERGHELALERVEQIISDGGYDYDLSMAALIDNAQNTAGYDVGWILAAYSASLAQQDTSAGDMAAKLEAVAADMFPVTYTEGGEAAAETIAYSPVTVTVVTGSTPTGSINGVTQYRYFTEQRTYYVPDGTTTEPTAAYSPVTVTVPVYSGGQITGTRQATYYTPSGSAPEASRVVVCTIHPFDSSVIYEAFGIDPDAVYDQFNITYAEAIDYMANALSKTLYGAENSTTTSAEAMSEAEISALVSALDCSDERKRVLETALSLVGRVPYFWGGKSAPGWNDEWNTPKLVTAAGSTTTGTIRPYGLDCSGFSDWAYQTALSVTIGAGTWGQWNASTEISEGELIPGDLGFQNLPNADTNHVLIYAGTDADGRQLWVHCTSGSGVVLNSPDYIRYYRRPNVALGDT